MPLIKKRQPVRTLTDQYVDVDIQISSFRLEISISIEAQLLQKSHRTSVKSLIFISIVCCCVGSYLNDRKCQQLTIYAHIYSDYTISSEENEEAKCKQTGYKWRDRILS